MVFEGSWLNLALKKTWRKVKKVTGPFGHFYKCFDIWNIVISLLVAVTQLLKHNCIHMSKSR